MKTRHLMILAAAYLSVVANAQAQQRDIMTELRLKMVSEYLEKEGIDNERVLKAMRTVPRHEFVRRSLRTQSYFDSALPIGYKQTISPPFIVAYMTQTIDPQPDEKVLEIGTGSGYQAAVLSHLCKEVYSIEIVEGLGRAASARLRQLRYRNVATKIGDGYQGWKEHAPFDKIIVTCSPEKIPIPLVQQLKEGGRMIIPLGERYQQVFYLLEKKDGKLEQQKLLPTLFVPMTGISEVKREVKPDPLNPQIVNGSFELDENEDGRADNWHYQRQTTLEKEGAPDGERFVCFESDNTSRVGQMLQGTACDGSQLESLTVSLNVKYENTVVGARRYNRPGLIVHCYDSIRRPVGDLLFGPWLGNSEWTSVSRTLNLPRDTREIVIQVGLNGATGKLCVDDLKISANKR